MQPPYMPAPLDQLARAEVKSLTPKETVDTVTVNPGNPTVEALAVQVHYLEESLKEVKSTVGKVVWITITTLLAATGSLLMMVLEHKP